MESFYDAKLFKDVSLSYKNNELGKIREFTLWFTQVIKESIARDDDEALKQMYNELISLKSDIEYTEPVNYNREYYLGFLSAYGNISRDHIETGKLEEKIGSLENPDSENEVEIYLSRNNTRIKDIINYLGNNGYSFQNQIAAGIGISENNLSNILSRPTTKSLNLFTARKIGRNVLYGLSRQGEDYFHKTKPKKNEARQTVMYYIDIIGASSFIPLYERKENKASGFGKNRSFGFSVPGHARLKKAALNSVYPDKEKEPLLFLGLPGVL